MTKFDTVTPRYNKSKSYSIYKRFKTCWSLDIYKYRAQNRWTDGQMDRWMDGWMDGQMDGWTDGQMN